MAQREQKRDIKSEVLWVLNSWESPDGKRGNELRVVRWIVEGKPGKPVVEKRDWFMEPGGEVMPGKARGLSALDLAKVLTNIRRIAKLTEMKDDHLDEALQLAMQPWLEKASPKTEKQPPPEKQAVASAPTANEEVF